MTKTALVINRQQTSPITIGLTPGRLSRAMRWHAVKAERQTGSTKVVANLLATVASASHRESEALQNKVYSFLQEATSIPEGSAAPSIRKMVQHMRLPSRQSNKTRWKGGADNVVEGETETDGLGR